MADWFKFYNDSIDEPRLQWAVSEQAEVLPVWVLILSECSKHYSGILSWRDKDYELLGYARKINVTPAKLNAALGLLVRIEYLEKTENHIKVLRWNDMQSIYCQRKASESVHSVRTVSAHTPHVVPLEERRGEERRIHTENGNGESVSVFEDLRTLISAIYGKTRRWSNIEESMLAEIARDPNSKSELETIISYRDRLLPKDKHFFPQSVKRLLTTWNELLDKAETHRKLDPRTAAEDREIAALQRQIDRL